MTRPSRYLRPECPDSGLVLQRRDREILLSVFTHRYLYSYHLGQLVCPGVSQRRLQKRLRQLWEHRYLDRHFIPFVLDGSSPPPEHAGQPLYLLAEQGAEVVAGELEIPISGIPHTPAQNAIGYATLTHHLVVTDLFAALTAGCRGREDVRLASVEPETRLRARAGAWAKQNAKPELALVPDGAFTLQYPLTGVSATFYVEGGARGGEAGQRHHLDSIAAVRGGEPRGAVPPALRP